MFVKCFHTNSKNLLKKYNACFFEAGVVYYSRRAAMIFEDGDMLVSYLNMKLRDDYGSLSELCEDLELDEGEIVEKIREAGYEYRPELNAIRPLG